LRGETRLELGILRLAARLGLQGLMRLVRANWLDIEGLIELDGENVTKEIHWMKDSKGS